MNEEKDFDLRDKIVCELLNGALAAGKDNDSSREILFYMAGNISNESRIENMIRSCYRIANIMRKVRLVAFE